MFGTRWLPEKEQELRRLAEAGWTGAEIARALSVRGFDFTRNAVLGKAWRMRIKLQGVGGTPTHLTPEERRARQAEAKRKSRAAHRMRAASERLVVLPAQPQVSEALPDTPPIGFMALTGFTCRWPVGDETPQMYCGAAKEFLLPYCPHHARERGRGGLRPQPTERRHVQNP